MKEKLIIKKSANQVYKRKIFTKILFLLVAGLLLLLSIMYGILYVVNKGGNFTINLDPNLYKDNSIVISPYRDFRTKPLVLKADEIEYMDNITEGWIPKDVIGKEGSNNGNDYIAYTFFVKNEGDKVINYNRVINIDSVIKNVDEAVRIALYYNGEKTVYAKIAKDGNPEPNTKAFYSNSQVMNELRKNFKPNDIDEYTILIWLEGEDPECIDDILGGEMKMLMYISPDRIKTKR